MFVQYNDFLYDDELNEQARDVQSLNNYFKIL